MQCFRYVLSAGRTGTLFLERLLNQSIDGVEAVHEPTTSRYQMLLANLRNEKGIGGGLLAKIFDFSRSRRVASTPWVYVEINPFLCAMTDLLPRKDYTLRVVHMVRDPATWASSIVSFKASARYRRFIDYIPYAKPYPSPRPEGWDGLSEYERALWRWNWCNEWISRLKDDCVAYKVVRYEDLFNNEREISNAALDEIVSILALPGNIQIGQEEIRRRINSTSVESKFVDKAAAVRICSDLARRYGYTY